MPLRKILPWCATVLLMFHLVGAAGAANPRTTNPSHAAPELPIAIHGEELSAKLHEEAAERAAVLAKLMPPLVQRDLKGQGGKNDPDDLTTVNTASIQLERIARQLQQLGEPAGYEFNLRVAFYRAPLTHAIDSFVASPPGMQYATKVRQQLAKSDRERAMTLKKLGELVEKKQYEEAERVWFVFFDKLREFLIFLPSAEGVPYVQPFLEIASQITNTMEGQRWAVAKEQLTQRRDRQRPNVPQFTAAIGATAQALAKSDRVMIDGAALSGPEAFTYYVSAWQKLHAAAVRCQGLTWALSIAGPATPGAGIGAVAAPMPVVNAGGESGKTNDPALDDYRARSTTQISQALAGLVAAEAMRVAPADVPALYLAWLDVAAGHTGRVQGDALSRALEPVLLQLAGRSPEFLAQVTAYDESTRELLRWKRRTAEAAVAPVLAQTPALDVAFRKAFTAEPNYAGLYPAMQPEMQPPTFFAAAPIVLPYGAERLLKQNVVLHAGQGLAGGKSNVTRLGQRVFATLKPPPESLAAAVTSLEGELFVTAERPPLSLAAAAALRSLQLGDFASAGGEVTGVHLEGCLTRISGLPDAAWPLVALGELPTSHTGERGAPPGLDRVIARLEVEPKWLRHEYVIVPLTAAQ